LDTTAETKREREETETERQMEMEREVGTEGRRDGGRWTLGKRGMRKGGRGSLFFSEQTIVGWIYGPIVTESYLNPSMPLNYESHNKMMAYI